MALEPGGEAAFDARPQMFGHGVAGLGLQAPAQAAPRRGRGGRREGPRHTIAPSPRSASSAAGAAARAPARRRISGSTARRTAARRPRPPRHASASAGTKRKPSSRAHRLALDEHFAALAHRRRKRGALLQAARQQGGAPVDEAPGQALVQRVGQSVLDRAGAGAQPLRVGGPAGAPGDVVPGPDMRDARRQHVDVAVRAVEAVHHAPDPGLRQHAGGIGQLAVDRRKQAVMRVGNGLAEVRHPADPPPAAPPRRNRRRGGRSPGPAAGRAGWPDRRRRAGARAPAAAAPPPGRAAAPPATTGRGARCANRPRSTAGKAWRSTAAAASGSSGGASRVVPKLPSRVWRPARPAIWAISAVSRPRWRRPSNLPRPANATWSTFMFRPMPMASVATR